MFKITINEPNKQPLHLDVHDGDADQIPVEISSESEKDLMKSGKPRTRVKRIVWRIYRAFREQIRIHIRAILHNTTHTEGEIRHTIERYTRKITYGTPHSERVELLSKAIQADPHEFARDLLRLEQRAVDLDAQLIGLNLIVGEAFKAEPTSHNLKSIILRCATPVIEVLKEHNVYINCEGVESSTITVDFRLFNCAMYHFFDNIKKYAKSDSVVRVTINDQKDRLTFDMFSQAIENWEKDSIFFESVSGKNAGGLKGEGFGMYIFAQVLMRLGAKPHVEWTDAARILEGENVYQHNFFIIDFPPGVLS